MLESLKNTKLYRGLNLSKDIHHAYLFFSLDRELNNNVAMSFAKTLICANNNACNECDFCHQFNSKTHPDLTIIDQSSIKVEDVNNIVSKLSTLPISANYKVFVILNAENINEIAQNKLLKSLEEPNATTIFILSTTKPDKLLPTVMSRLHKINLPKLSDEDLAVIGKELKELNVDTKKYSNLKFNLTELIDIETNAAVNKTINSIKYIFENLNATGDIPRVVSSMPEYDKNILLALMQKLFVAAINQEFSVDEYLCTYLTLNYPKQALINCLPLIEKAYSMQMSNVNINYILDNLLFDILKEKFLCKQSN